MIRALFIVVFLVGLLIQCKESKVVVVTDYTADSEGSTSTDGTTTGALPPPGACQPNVVLACVTPYSFKRCDKDGVAFEEVKCGNGKLCFEGGKCQPAVCIPGTRKCQGPTIVGECAKDGSGYETATECEAGLVCASDNVGEATCASSCGGLGKAISNVGCTYALVDLGNYESDPKNNLVDRPVMVVVSNTSGAQDAHVTITSTQDGTQMDYTEEELTVPPQELKTFLLPTGFGQLYTQVTDWSWQLKSDQPVTAHLFNPENGPDVRSNDATLLFPTDALGANYVVVGWKSFYSDAQGFDDDGFPNYGFDSYVTVVAVDPGITEVTIRPTADLRSGKVAGGAVIPEVKKGKDYIFKLEQWQVANFTVKPTVGEMDLTGTTVAGDRNIAVFTAHNCAFVPDINVKYCDHLEHQLAPVKTWGSVYAADLFHPRAEGAYDVWRVMAGQDETVVTTNPPVPGFESQILNKGQWIEYKADFPHLISAASPGVAQGAKAKIQVGHYMTGSNIPNFEPVCGDALTGIGDPAFTIGVALNQYIDSYVVLTPPGYTDDYLNIVRKKSVKVLLDDQEITQAGVPIGDTGYELVRVAVEDGVHRLKSPDGDSFGVTAYGYDCDVSYAYPGGMLLQGN